jgi:hypothetical protein
MYIILNTYISKFNINFFLKFGIDIYATFKPILEQDVNNLNSAKFVVVVSTSFGFCHCKKILLHGIKIVEYHYSPIYMNSLFS